LTFAGSSTPRSSRCEAADRMMSSGVPRDSARFHPLRGHQDRYARRGHHHVSAAHWRSKPSTVE
jgi:hypothetical protein